MSVAAGERRGERMAGIYDLESSSRAVMALESLVAASTACFPKATVTESRTPLFHLQVDLIRLDGRQRRLHESHHHRIAALPRL